MWLFILPEEGKTERQVTWTQAFCTPIYQQVPFDHSHSSSFTMQTAVTLPETNQMIPKHTTRNPNKTLDKQFQGVCCSRKLAGSPAKIWAAELCCPPLPETHVPDSGPEGVFLSSCRITHQPIAAHLADTICPAHSWKPHLLPPAISPPCPPAWLHPFILSSPPGGPLLSFVLALNPFSMPILGPAFTRYVY